MAYNNGFPMNYGYYQNQMQQPVPQLQFTQPQESGILWVQGEAGAKSWAVAPGKNVLLMDSESNKFYIKSSDPSGMPMPLRVFDYTEQTGKSEEVKIDTSEFVTKKELEEKLKELFSKEEK